MKVLNVVTLALIIIGGLNWLLFGIANVDLVASLFGGPNTAISKLVYVLVGLSAVYQLYPFSLALSDRRTEAYSQR